MDAGIQFGIFILIFLPCALGTIYLFSVLNPDEEDKKRKEHKSD